MVLDPEYPTFDHLTDDEFVALAKDDGAKLHDVINLIAQKVGVSPVRYMRANVYCPRPSS